MTEDLLIEATHEGVVRISEETALPCAVLEDGTRVLTQTEFVKAIGRRGSVKKGQVWDENRRFQVPVFLSASNLTPFISDQLIEASSPIPFRTTRGMVGRGYRAELLPEVCNVFIDARDAGALHKSQLHVAERCRLLIRAYATVGIIALVDEATGYQETRARNALEQILAKYLSDHRLKWAKTFPDDFYKEIFRLRRWSYGEAGFRKRPAVVGHYTNNIVYERLAPGVLTKLEELNPRAENGHRSSRHHQWLSQDHGVPELKTHLAGVIALMRASRTWEGFCSLVDRAYPVPGQQLTLDMDDD